MLLLDDQSNEIQHEIFIEYVWRDSPNFPFNLLYLLIIFVKFTKT